MTILLGRSDLERLLSVEDCLTALRAGLTAEPDPIRGQRVRTDLPGPGTATALLPGLLPGVPAYTVKVNAKFPTAVPALRGLVCLHDLETGELLAVLDSATVTAWRTGLAAAIGTHELARPDAVDVGVIGAGAQARLVIRGLRALRRVRDVVAYDLDPERARAFPAEVATSPRDVADRCDLVVLATWSRSPLLGLDDVRPGTHLTLLGVDEPGKAELAPDLFGAARVVVDDPELALVPDARSASSLTDVLRGVVPGRTSHVERTVYAPIGLPWQDLSLSWLAYRAAVATDTGTRFDWLA